MFNALNRANLASREIASVDSNPGSANWKYGIEKIRDSINSLYNNIAFTVDLINDKPFKVRLFALRSFGESLYYSITDASLEFGYENK